VPGNVTKTVSGSPQGVISYNAGTLTYTPHSLDKEPFSVTFTGIVGGQSVTQAVKITPIPILKPEAESFGVTPIPITPESEESSDYISFTNVTSSTQESFNNLTRLTRTVTISGKTVVLQKGHLNKLYEALNDNQDIKSLTIYAEKLIVRSPVNLPQSNVTIYAKELRFEDPVCTATCPPPPVVCFVADLCPKASIITTPISLTTRLPQLQNGANGLKAGDIALHIETFYSTLGYDKRFILTGGNGQPAGQGKPGIDSLPVATVNDPSWAMTNVLYNHTVYIEIWYVESGTWACMDGCDLYFDRAIGKQIVPQSGGNATPAGKPGNAGNGGNFKSISDVMPYADSKGGVSGAKGDDQPGGKKGLPSPAYYVKYDESKPVQQRWSQILSFTTTDGANAPAPSAAIPVGQDGTKSSPTETRQTAWLSPYALQKIIAHAKDAYRYSRNLDYAQSIFDKYVKLLDTYKSQQSAEWASLDPKWQLEFSQMKSEMQTLLHRIANNLDYFGNPAGWVPMLSFEVNMTVFNNEIDRAFNEMYLSYWVSHKAAVITQQIDALKTVRSKMKTDIEDFKDKYGKAVGLVSDLQTKADQIASDISFLQSELQALEQQLIERAKNNVEDRHKEQQWRQAAQILGTVCRVIPIGQPVLGAIGTGLQIASSYDPKNLLATIMKLPEIVTAYNSTAYLDTAKQWDTALDGISLTNLENIDSFDSAKTYFDNLKKFADVATPAAKALYSMKDVFNETKVADEEVNAELQRIKAESPEFNQLIDQVKELMVQKQLFVQQLASVTQTVSTLQGNITHNLLAIDSLNQGITKQSSVLNERTLMYLSEMDRRAKERLLKYHYYMAKSYEYRMLKPYDGELKLDRMIDAIIKISEGTFTHIDGSKTDSGGSYILGSEDFKSLKALYEEQIADITEKLVTGFNEGTFKTVSTTTIRCDFKDVIEKLNANINTEKSVRVNLADVCSFPAWRENIRIVKPEIKTIQVDTAGTPYNAAISLIIKHSGVSKLNSDGNVYQFRHYNSINPNNSSIQWELEYDAVYNAINPIRTNDSLLKSLLGLQGQSLNDIQLYSRPAAWADIDIQSKVNADNNSALKIRTLVLEVTYEYQSRNSGLTSLKVLPPANDFAPYIILNTQDKNERQDGLGSFYRTYSTGNTVTLKAPQTYGEWNFDKWTDSSGTTLGTNQLLTVSLSSDKVIRPNYIRASGSTGTPGDVNGLGSVDLTDAIAGLQVLAGLSPPNVKVGADVNGNNKIGLEEVIYILQKAAGLR